jgi:hypothetical protein
MDSAPTIYTIPKYLSIRAARLRWAARGHLLLVPLAIWIPLLMGLRTVNAAAVGAVIFVGLGALLQLAPLGAPRTMRRRYRRLTGQAAAIALAAFCVLALAVVTDRRLVFVALGTVALDVPVAIFLLISLPVYLVPHPEDVQRP